MALQVRRVITGHDGNGRAIVKIDEGLQTPRLGPAGRDRGQHLDHRGLSSQQRRRRPTKACARSARPLTNGTIFRVIEFAPGLAARNHRTDSIDYIVIISGEIDMELDDSVVHLKAGDVMVQRGTIHNWVNNGTAPCVLAVILIDAEVRRSRRQDRLNAIGWGATARSIISLLDDLDRARPDRLRQRESKRSRGPAVDDEVELRAARPADQRAEPLSGLGRCRPPRDDTGPGRSGRTRPGAPPGHTRSCS